MMRQTIQAVLLALALGASACASAPHAETAAVADSALRAPRHIALDGVYNFRDLGGYRTVDGQRVKWGVIYRSAALSRASAEDVAEIEALGVRNIYDLRSSEERTQQPTTWQGRPSPHIFAHDYSLDRSVISGVVRPGASAGAVRAAFAQSYPDMLRQTQPQQRALFEGLLAAEGPVLFHCTAGKDRTGMAAALVLSVLRVPRDVIFADYDMSNQYLAPSDPRMAALNLSPEAMHALAGVEPAYLQAAFDYIDTNYGSVDAYVERELGVTAADRRRLRQLYTE
jgi:protein-tyrosine phosphatase